MIIIMIMITITIIMIVIIPMIMIMMIPIITLYCRGQGPQGLGTQSRRHHRPLCLHILQRGLGLRATGARAAVAKRDCS